MADDHYMPLFWGDFLAATSKWTGPARGLYVQLLATQWSAGALPANLEDLSLAMGYRHADFMQLWPTMSDKFQKTRSGLVNSRLEEIRNKNKQIRAERQQAGSKGGSKTRAKWVAKEQQSNQQTEEQTKEQKGSNPLLHHPNPNPNPNPDLITESEPPHSLPSPVGSVPAPKLNGHAVVVSVWERSGVDPGTIQNLNREAFERFVAYRARSKHGPVMPSAVRAACELYAQHPPEFQALMLLQAEVEGWRKPIPEEARRWTPPAKAEAPKVTWVPPADDPEYC